MKQCIYSLEESHTWKNSTNISAIVQLSDTAMAMGKIVRYLLGETCEAFV